MTMRGGARTAASKSRSTPTSRCGRKPAARRAPTDGSLHTAPSQAALENGDGVCPADEGRECEGGEDVTQIVVIHCYPGRRHEHRQNRERGRPARKQDSQWEEKAPEMQDRKSVV